MDSVWILASLAAAFFQALRYAALKVLNRTLPTTVATYARMLFGMPFLTLHLIAVMLVTDSGRLHLSTSFLMYSALATAQFAGSAIIVYAFQLGNFAVATMLVKTDVVATAVLGMLLFSQPISLGGWVAIVITLVAGVLVTSAGRLPSGAFGAGRISLADFVVGRAARVALLAALVYSVSYLFLREAIISLGPEVGGPAIRAAWAGVVMTVVMMGGWLLVRERQAFRQMLAMPGPCMFLGLVSALGTIFWFFASALTNAAYVAAVAQVQIAFTLAISHFYFKERLRPLELVGIVIILFGVLFFRFA